MNFIKFGGWFFSKYAYIDLNVNENFAADSLFYKRKIRVYFGEEWSRPKDTYKIIFCKVKKKYSKLMEEAFEELKTKMYLLGYNDYEDYCNETIGYLTGGLNDTPNKSV